MRNNLLIAVTCHNKFIYTKQAVESILKAGFKNIVVLDDNSTDQTKEYFKNHPIVEYIRQTDDSKLTGLWNKAYKRAQRFKYLIIANNDIIVPSGAIDELLNCANRT